MQKIYKPELLAPAGDLEKLKIAIIYGADAVFIGGKKFSLRAKASNFELEDIKEAVIFAHENNSRVHITVNVYPHSEDLEGLDEYLLELDKINVDAIIVSSPYIVKRARELGCKFEIHISTQQSTANYEAMTFWENLGANRIVLARELSINDIEKLKGETTLPLEVFIHGGLCSSFSGRCTLSNNMTLRDANRGGCAHSCRWFYDIYEDNKRLNNDKESFRLGSKDLCAATMIDKLIDLKVDSFKIEGRMKSLHYIACVVQAYRKLIDDYLDGKLKDSSYYLNMLFRAENRATTKGFLNKDITHEDGLFEIESEQPSQDFLGIVIDYDNQEKLAKIQQRNHFKTGEKISVMQPFLEDVNMSVLEIYDEYMNKIEIANHAMDILYIKTEFPIKKYGIIRRR
ncbi:MAG: U32 family peptidase [Bacilli bacterium]|nr:U32 family peptidase [Bacilli bacterium]